MENPFKKRFSLSLKLAIAGLVIGTLTGSVFGIFSILRLSQNIQKEVTDTIDRSARALLPSTANALWNFDPDALDSIVNGLLEIPSIAAVKVHESSGNLNIERTSAERENASPPDGFRPSALFFHNTSIVSTYDVYTTRADRGSERLGSLEIVSAPDVVAKRIDEQLHSTFLTVTLVGAAFSVATLLGGYLLAARPLSEVASAVTQARSKLYGVPVIRRDLTERSDEIGELSRAIVSSFSEANKTAEALSESESRFRDLIEGSVQGCVIWCGNKALFANKAALTLFGKQTAKEMFSVTLRSTFPEDMESLNLERKGKHDSVRHQERQHRLKADGTPIIVSSIMRPILWQGKPSWQETLVNITDRVRAEEELERLSTRDALTGLANRALFTEQLAQLIQAEPDARHAVFVTDLNDFKRINDHIGFEKADKLLRAVAEGLYSALPHDVILARLNADTYGLIKPHISNEKDIIEIHRQTMNVIRRDYEIDGDTIALDARSGVSVFPTDGQDVATLLSRADTAMFAAKQEKVEEVRFFDPGLSVSAHERMDLERALKLAIRKEGELFLVYQPKINAQENRPVSVEALIRWRRDGDVISPGQFIPMAEETGLIIPLGRKVILMAARQALVWRQELGHSIPIAVNVATAQFTSGTLVKDIENALELGISPGDIEIEVTESATINDIGSVIAQLTRLRKLGIKVAMDDFGTGYSSLSYLHQLPLDYLKLDQSFARLLSEPHGRAIASTISSMGRTLGLTVIAEGVETDAEVNILNELGYDQFQGYHFARPMESNALSIWWKEQAA